MLRPIFLGTVAAVVIALISRLTQWMEGVFPRFSLQAPVLILGVTAVAMLLQRFVLDRKPGPRAFNGLADFFAHIHGMGSADPAIRWFIRGCNSLLLSFFGGSIGPEGAASEIAQATGIESRDRTSRFSEQRRRVDAASALAGGIAAAFGAPFAAVLVPIELGLGGPAVRPVAAALAAFLVSSWIGTPSGPNGFPGLRAVLENAQLGWLAWIGILAIALMFSPLGLLFIRLTSAIRRLLEDLFQRQIWMRILVTGGLVTLLAMIFPAAHGQPWKILEQVLWGTFSGSSLALLLLVQVGILALVLAGFGSVGVFWPVFSIGATFGIAMDHWVFQGLPGFTALGGIAGAGAAWGAILGAPLAAGVLAFELTHSWTAMLVALAAALVARATFRFIGAAGMISSDLEARGMRLIDGRSFDVLDAIPIREAMVVDFETVHEHEPVSELHARLLKSRYPFIPVVSLQGIFRGVLTVDMIQEAWHTQQKTPGEVFAPARHVEGHDLSHDMMMRLIEAKDLLYRAGLKFPTVRLDDKLSSISGKFDESPCVAVVTDDEQVVGLLFVHQVRLAYDRELARRALLTGTAGNSVNN
ncbi:MAG: hypothetical protein A2X94_03760 [Bdellovibrionales bacterium GWB1_55_8]|nr:MAG: hypothetical protein A2X94_03760 [Bdellovibrionales bacterium GWB1_55_8]